MTAEELDHGIVLPNWAVDGDTERLVEYGVAAEDAGWDGVFLADHLAMSRDGDHPPFPDPWITLAGIAARTDEIRLGTWVTPVPADNRGSSRGTWPRWTGSPAAG